MKAPGGDISSLPRLWYISRGYDRSSWDSDLTMRFIEITGKSLARIVSDDEISVSDLRRAGVEDDTVVRINLQGDIEVRRPDRWDVIGGLLGNFEERIKKSTGMTWA